MPLSRLGRRRPLTAIALAALAASLGAAGRAAAQVTWNLTSTANIGGFATTVTGAPQVVATPFGNGLRFDGNDGVVVSNNPLAGATAFTMEMLLRPDPNPSATLDEPRILHIESKSPSGSRALLEGRIVGNMWYQDGFLLAPPQSNPSGTPVGLPLIDPAKQFPVDRWYSYALWYNGATLKVFLNGIEILSGSHAVTSIPAGVTSIGMRENVRNFFKGDVARVRFTPAAIDPAALMSNRLPGDFNGDFYAPGGGIDDRDLALWKEQFGTAGPFPNFGASADADGDGDVDGADLLVWQRSQAAGPTAAEPAQHAAPEPSAAILAWVAALAGGLPRRRPTSGGLPRRRPT
jgi:hypothetical protein